jgi:hypothetical protein
MFQIAYKGMNSAIAANGYNLAIGMIKEAQSKIFLIIEY